MNCFVMMPFLVEFDDVYSAIKTNVEEIISPRGGTCIRLDEQRPAGRITDRLRAELLSADLCIADVTGSRPNVMWELGYAMALSKPTILLTQNISELPFDIKDLQTLEYNRNHVNRSFRQLSRMVSDTLTAIETGTLKTVTIEQTSDFVRTLSAEVSSLKTMLSDVVKAWARDRERPPDTPTNELTALEGCWLDAKSGSHIYARVVGGKVLAPYCWHGDDHLTSVFYDWTKMGDHWFCRFSWVNKPTTGYAFLEQTSLHALTGAWWLDDEVDKPAEIPEIPGGSGEPLRIERLSNTAFPVWASDYLENARKEAPSTHS